MNEIDFKSLEPLFGAPLVESLKPFLATGSASRVRELFALALQAETKRIQAKDEKEERFYAQELRVVLQRAHAELTSAKLAALNVAAASETIMNTLQDGLKVVGGFGLELAKEAGKEALKGAISGLVSDLSNRLQDR